MSEEEIFLRGLSNVFGREWTIQSCLLMVDELHIHREFAHLVKDNLDW